MTDDLVQHFFNAPGDELPPDWFLPKLLADIPLAESASKLEPVVANPFRFTSFLAAAMSAVVLIWWSVSGWVLEICATKQGSGVRRGHPNWQFCGVTRPPGHSNQDLAANTIPQRLV